VADYLGKEIWSHHWEHERHGVFWKGKL